jgi:hypothetical protein
MVNEHRAVGPDTQHEIVEPATAMLALRTIVTWLDAMLLEDAERPQSQLEVELAGVVSVPAF